ncbi:MAG TPA: DUF349 domain-containing protein [Cytophagales bacterium]|jgi:hypothetical protein|nr:DUF349 domain-containing protein [Cytophagales bacterium]
MRIVMSKEEKDKKITETPENQQDNKGNAPAEESAVNTSEGNKTEDDVEPKAVAPDSGTRQEEATKEASGTANKMAQSHEEASEDKDGKREEESDSKPENSEEPVEEKPVEKPGAGVTTEEATKEKPETSTVSEVKKEEEIKEDTSAESASKEEGESEPSDENKEEGAGEGEQEEQDHQLDYSNYTKKQMVQVLESMSKSTDYNQLGRVLKEIRPAFDDIFEEDKKKAYDKYIEEGGDKDGFEYKMDELDNKFNTLYNELRQKRHQFFNDLENQKEKNYERKLEILEELRELVDGEETSVSIKDLKDLQDRWKNVGPIPHQHSRSLWANYNALIDRFYDNRSIYFELKELDRKKNYNLKLELCERAEKLEEEENIKEAIKALNELHEEYKHIGPVPKEDQEPLWQRFKAASDKVYARRKVYYEQLKGELETNLIAKKALVEKVQSFSEFDSEKISDWNAKTKEILEVQKEWEAVGGLPKEHAKSVNKAFWKSFKAFFNHKGNFFKKLEELRGENLKKKEELVQRAESLKDSEDFIKTAEELKALQRQWKEIGPVPEKHRNEVYQRFKKACDHFFDRKRAAGKEIEKDYVENLKKKEALCEEIEKIVAEGPVDVDRVEAIVEEWPNIGFVPKKDIKTIQKRYNDAIQAAADKAELNEDEAHKLKFKAQFNKSNYGPNAERMIAKKEHALRRQIAKLENDIDLWKNNMLFFAESKKADKLKEEFNQKINKAKKELEMLEEKLRMINNI